MARKKILYVSVTFIVLMSVAGFIAFANQVQGAENSDFPDFKKTVSISAKYSQLKVNVRLNPDKTCVYTLINDSLEYKGTWEFTEKKSEALKIIIDVSGDGSSKDSRLHRIVTLYDNSKSNRMAAVPVEFIKGQFMIVYGEWKQ